MSGTDDKDKNKKPPGEGEEETTENSGEATGGQTGGEGTGPKTLEEAAGIIASLRKENAKHRTKNKSLEENVGRSASELKKVKEALGLSEDDQEDPKTTIANLQKQNEAAQVDLSIAELAIEHGITADKKKYFKFLLAEKIGNLEDGEEISDEDIASVVAEVKGVSGKKQTSTGQGGKVPSGDTSGAITVEQFGSMSLAERSEVYDKNPDLYESLMAKARAKNLIR